MNALKQAAEAISGADAILIGASNGLSIAEGYHIFADNEMFRSQFGDIAREYGIRCVIDGCFYRYPTEQARRQYMERLVRLWMHEYKPSKVMADLLEIVGQKDYFVLTSNADTHLELSGFDADRVFEVEGTFEDMLEQRPPRDKSGAADEFLRRYSGRRLVILELGIGRNNRLIKLPLMQLAAAEPHATYITLNLGRELYIPEAIARKSIGLEGDIAATLAQLTALLPWCSASGNAE